jgi:glycosyltransferase involved in cell wall biosynthesis
MPTFEDKVDFTVIIIAYDRRTFLKNSVESVLSQHFLRERYEIIVSRNFEDSEIDEFLLKNNVKLILNTDPGIGQRLNECILKSKGKIIAFLEDDDSWMRDRLSIVFEVFSREDRLGYYHNAYLAVNEKMELRKDWIHHTNIKKTTHISGDGSYKNILPKIMRFSPEFNISSICISKELATRMVGKLPKLSMAIDLYFFLFALSCNSNLYIDERKLTKYMVHESNMNKAGNFHQFLLSSLKTYSENRESIETLTKLIDNDYLRSIARSYLAEWEVRLCILRGSDCRITLLRTIFSEVKLFFLKRNYSKYFFLIGAVAIVLPKIVRHGYYFYLKYSLLKY